MSSWPKGNVQAGLRSSFTPGCAAALGIGVHASLQMGIHKGFAKINAAHFQKPHQPVDIGIIIGMHGRGMALP